LGVAEGGSRVIDVHAHYLPPGSFRERPGGGVLSPELFDLTLQASQMAAAGIHRRVVCPPPFALRYEGEDSGYDRGLNDALAEAVARAPGGRFWALATVPLHRPVDAAAELGRAMGQLGMRGATIASEAGPGRELDDPGLEPFWATAEALGAFILLHPGTPPGGERMGTYHLRNLVGNPLATAHAAARLIFGGVLDRHPDLRIVLSHGGGALPWVVSRLDHGYRVRPECARACPQPPSAYLRRFYYDTLVFTDEARRWLREQVGGDRVLFGTDAPFDMGDVSGVAAADHGEAARLLGWEG
jgi:aminocarboxymuconate-semialdehyde decarboxylase